ncbi:MAG: zinc ribbon domain-containing protein [Clostridia bacterium]|nr:zinc ribbon domain-containing protein [Clostridia bacterium]
MFCQKCGKQIPEDSRVCQYCGVPVMGQPQNMNVNYQPMKPKKTPWKIIIPIVAVLLVIAIVIAVVVFVKKKDDAKLIEILEKYTDEPIVELICEDFDDNGEKEAYAVVGDSEEKEEYTEYIDADVYFVNQTEAEVIKEDVSGHSNGTIEVDDTIYVSFEIYDDEAETGHSYVYTVRENEPAEAEISGKYSDVHQDGMKIYATDVNGQIIEIELEPQKWEEAKEEDFKNFDKIINIHAVNVKNYSVDAPRAFSIAYACLSGYDG